MRAPQIRSWLLSLLFVSFITYTSSGQAEQMARQAVATVYDMSVGDVLTKAAELKFGNKLINRFILKLNNKIKEVLSESELGEDLINKTIGLLDSSSDSIHALKSAVETEAMAEALTPVITAIDSLKMGLEKALNVLQMAKSAVSGAGAGQTGGGQTGIGQQISVGIGK